MTSIAVTCLGRTEDLQRSLEEALIELRDLKSERFSNHLTFQFKNESFHIVHL